MPRLVSRIKIMADMNIAERYMPQDGHIQIHHRGVARGYPRGHDADDLRRKHGDAVAGEKLANCSTPAGTGPGPGALPLLARLVEKPHGLFLTTGPTGSGKTTTLYSILRAFTPRK